MNDELLQPLFGQLWQPLWLSLRVASAATVLAALVAVPLAFVMARRTAIIVSSARSPGRPFLAIA